MSSLSSVNYDIQALNTVFLRSAGIGNKLSVVTFEEPIVILLLIKSLTENFQASKRKYGKYSICVIMIISFFILIAVERKNFTMADWEQLLFRPAMVVSSKYFRDRGVTATPYPPLKEQEYIFSITTILKIPKQLY
ncbi:hypothetical protein M0813_24243 [Anaeramoeba flamelloides]|uniref:Uncharacterized protein n=1 Tax=Anaeramoeba flamelloides TaxID=1746091 RepID=A0ABQ8Y6C9_9EUKA|nr:hypothetical protein M0813_24243 [Anaeramoeba flamelloides]